MKKLFLTSLVFFAFHVTCQAQIMMDTLRYFTNKQLYKAPTFTAHPFYKFTSEPFGNPLQITHVGSVFRNTTTVSVTGLEARVLKSPLTVSLAGQGGVPARLYLCNVANGLPVFPPLDSVAVGVIAAIPASTGQTVGGGFTVPKIVTGDFAVLIRVISVLSGDTIKVFRTAGHTATSVAAPAYQFGEGLGVLRSGGQFYKTTDYNSPGFGIGTDYEFCVAPRLQFPLTVSQIAPDQQGICCFDAFTSTCTATPALINRQFNFNEFYRELKPFNPATLPANTPIDSVLTWYMGDGSVYYLPPNSNTVQLAFSGNCNQQVYTSTLTGQYRHMASPAVPSYSTSTTFTSSTYICAAVSIPEQEAFSGLQVFPNPAADKTTICGLKGMNTISVYNLQGQLLSSQATDKETATVDLQKMPAGICLVRINAAGGHSKTIKLIRQ